MSVYLMAPWDLIQATVMLPNPQLGDLNQKQHQVNIRNSIDGTFYSYVKSSKVYTSTEGGFAELDRHKLSWEFKLRRGKADELLAFVEAYYGYKWRVIDWNERTYCMNMTNDPVEFTCMNKAGIYSVRLELQGELVQEPS